MADTADWDVASDRVSHAYFPHRLSPLTRAATAHLHVDSVELGALRIAHIGWGADVSVDSEHRGAYAVNIPLSGYLQSRTGRHEVLSTPGRGTICPADTPTSITRWSESCSILGVRLDRDYLHREMVKVLAEPERELPPQIDLTTGDGRSWLQLVQSLSGRLRTGGGVWDNSLVADQLSGALTSAFILAAMPEDVGGTQAARPRIVKRVLDELESDPAKAWTAADMAELAGVSVRRLQEGFREYVGCSPRECLVNIRLSRARLDLLDGSGTVADIALRWGFTHTGRFAATYRAQYGVAPSQQMSQ
ncbi:AraC family transcriptional regulator [Rhodococcus sp. G-MC3]|uniref:AraC family transcriptional regulator n=1 Tax=Rhodococcus sp. G-MC3 TaxID=3046209 RepID=UPI0024B884A8|nr:AraC family transcriptional regulator [Rhodococcus sp. G-MC3]MDJ0396243.1 AraC family transcriptional regulator [Rhodococcus sp. G-MC3]